MDRMARRQKNVAATRKSIITPPDVAYDAAGRWLAHQSRARSSVQSLARLTLARRRDSSRAV